MSTYFTIWHWLAIIIFATLFVLLSLLSLKEKNQNTMLSMIFASFLVLVTAAFFSLLAIDKYTKVASLYGVKNTRILRNETIVFTGYVKNTGNYKIGEITLSVKLVNKGHVTGNVRGGNFYRPNGIIEFFTSFGSNTKADRPQKIENDFVVARDVEPGKAVSFRVQMPYPPYFQHVSQFTSVTAH